MNYLPVEKIESPSKKEFYKNFVNQPKPVILKDLSKDWPAREKWTFDFFKINTVIGKFPCMMKTIINPDLAI